ncbi:MAG: hypothetical protein ACI3Y0_04675 [Prevotella sp.]
MGSEMLEMLYVDGCGACMLGVGIVSFGNLQMIVQLLAGYFAKMT